MLKHVYSEAHLADVCYTQLNLVNVASRRRSKHLLDDTCVVIVVNKGNTYLVNFSIFFPLNYSYGLLVDKILVKI